jgi:hypothetical protein
MWQQGSLFPSGNRDPRTGETPMDNFICDRCQEEARALRVMDRAVNQYWKRRGGVRVS